MADRKTLLPKRRLGQLCLFGWRGERRKGVDSGGVASKEAKIRAAGAAARGPYEDFPLFGPLWGVVAFSASSPSPRLTCGSPLCPSE